ncbi:putative membrane protein YeiB [Sporosarcina luteola]|nr:putative membrane protein YeiB [Sporosarcina luteola]
MEKRITELDAIRGFALLGIMLVNILGLLYIEIPDLHTMSASYQRFLYLFVEGRFYTIFSFLFGVGFYIFLTRAKTKGQNGTVLFLRRMAVLFVFGMIHQKFHPGEALAVYAVCGLLVLPFSKANRHVNLVIALGFLTMFAMTGVKILLPLPLILLGFACGQYRVFENLANKKGLYLFTSIMAILSAVAFYMQYKAIPINPFSNMFFVNEDGSIDSVGDFLKIGITIGPILSACYIGILLIVMQTKAGTYLLTPLTYYGRMALTNYVGQTAFILLIGPFFPHLTYMDTLFVCLSIFAVQIVFSMIWLRHFKMGPLEWVWRIITYWRLLPLRKAAV